MRFTIQPRTRIWLAVGWFLLTTLLLAMPGNALPKTNLVNIPNFDKLVHVGLFAVLTFLTVNALNKPTYFKITVVALIAILYGIIMEYVQLHLVAYRSFEGIDIIADATGAIAAALFFYFKMKKSAI
jgi:VanZ family protein